MSYAVLASSINHPDRRNPLWGLFNHRSLTALSLQDVTVEAVVPRPHAPPVGPYSGFRSLPKRDDGWPYPVSHPRFFYLVPKSLLYHRTGDSMATSVQRWYNSRDLSPDVLHGCHLYPDGYALRAIARAEDLPLTTYAHGTIINSFEGFNSGTRRRIRRTLSAADRVLCSGDAIQRKIQKIDPAAHTDVVPIGATPSNFPTERRELLRRELNLPDEATVVLFCGHLTAEKGVGDLIDVLPAVSDRNLYVVFIGHGGDMRSQVRNALARPGTPPGRLLWELHPVAVRRYFAAADLLVLPSYSEGRPTVIYEAMASQTPVLASSVGGIPEQISDGETGHLVDPGDSDALASKLRTLARVDLEAMGVRAERRLERMGWTWSGHAKAIQELHRDVIRENDPTTSSSTSDPSATGT